MLTKEDLIKEGTQFGVTDISDAEYEANKKFAIRVALNRILNMRKGVHLAKDREAIKAIILGGRDFLYKGITLEQTRSQYISVIANTNDGPKLMELTQWGHFKEARHGDGCELEYEKKTSTLDDGSSRENLTIKKVVVKKEKAIQSYADIKKSGLLIKKPEDIDEDNLYDVIAVEGIVTNVDEMPIWGTASEGAPPVREGAYPTWVNNQPCLRLALKSDNANRIFINLNPTNLAQTMIGWPEDFNEICKTNNLQEALATFINVKVLAVGCVRKFKTQNEGNMINLDATALFTSDDFLPPATVTQAKIDAPAPTQAPTKAPAKKGKKKDEPPAAPAAPAPTAPATPAPATPAPAAPATPVAATKPAAPTTGAATVLEGYKASVASLMDVLGTEITAEDVKSAKVLPETCGDVLIAALIKRVKFERSSA